MHHITLNKGHVTPAGLWWATGHDLDDPDVRACIDRGITPLIGAASIGDAVENKILDQALFGADLSEPCDLPRTLFHSRPNRQPSHPQKPPYLQQRPVAAYASEGAVRAAVVRHRWLRRDRYRR
jgi:hypothetical protein